jgi:hypothetical protein
VVVKRNMFINNIATQRTKNIFCGFSSIWMTGCIFKSKYTRSPEIAVLDDLTYGAFIFIIFDVKIEIIKTKFYNGLS